MTLKPLLAALAVLGLVGCAQLTPASEKPVVPSKPVAPSDKKAAAETAVMPPQPLTEQLLYQFLLAETAWQRGERRLAAEAYADLAARTGDVRIARRATELAVLAQAREPAMQAAKLWVELEPDSERARQIWITLLAASGRVKETRPHFEALLQAAGAAPGPVFMQMHALFSRQADHQAVSEFVDELARAYPNVAEAHFAVAQAAWNAGRFDRAEQAVASALALRPDWENAALLRGQLLQRKSDAEALAYWSDFLARNPGARELRLAHAKQLAQMGRYADSRQEFERLLGDGRSNAEAPMAVGLLAMQAGDYETAEVYLLKALELGYAEADQLKLYLGQVNEARKRPEEALRWYRAVDRGPRHLAAQLLAATLLGKQDKIAEARTVLHGLAPADDAERIQVVQTEAQILREARDHAEVYKVLSQALARYPEAPELLYDRAMAAEKLGKIDVLEKDLRKLIKLRPDHAHAYNALGYTLADRTKRLGEAIELLKKALQLAPNDAFVLDSMGWAQFKAGKLNEAADYLKRAYAGRPDPEIAAHLGEVLWKQGKRDEAKQLWDAALKAHPDNEVLRDTVSRLKP